MNLSQAILVAAIGMLACGGLIPLICRRLDARGGPGRGRDLHHHNHAGTVPRYGGLALAGALAAITLSLAFAMPPGTGGAREFAVIVAGALAMFGLGFWDDLRPLRARTKFLGQIAIASAVYLAGIQIEVVKNPFTLEPVPLGVLGYFATVFWLVAMTNLINLTDGIDGLAGGISLMLMCLLAAVGSGTDNPLPALLAAGMGGALIGFLYHNFPPAKIYMGDGGAYLLGFLIGILSLVNAHKGTVMGALLAPMLALALPIADVILAILRRSLSGLPIFRPDRKHIHHRLLDRGLSRQGAVLVLYSFSGFCLLLALGVFWLENRLWPLLFGALCVVGLGAARAFGVLKHWHGPGALSNLRQETRYALVLGEWLKLEAGRRDSIQGLWQDYQFVARKLGFTEVRLSLPDGSLLWRAHPGGPDPVAPLRRASHELDDDIKLEFAAAERPMPEHVFQLLTELAAEIWLKSARRWQQLNQVPIGCAAVSARAAVAAVPNQRRAPIREPAPAGTDTPPWTDGEDGLAPSTLP